MCAESLCWCSDTFLDLSWGDKGTQRPSSYPKQPGQPNLGHCLRTCLLPSSCSHALPVQTSNMSLLFYLAFAVKTWQVFYSCLYLPLAVLTFSSSACAWVSCLFKAALPQTSCEVWNQGTETKRPKSTHKGQIWENAWTDFYVGTSHLSGHW